MGQTNERVIAFLQGLDIKTAAFGGFDKADTFETLKDLSALYEELLDEQRKELTSAAAAAATASAAPVVPAAPEASPVDTAQLQAAQREIQSLTQKIQSLTQKIQSLETEKQALAMQLQDTSDVKGEYTTKLNELASSMTFITQSVDKAKQEAEQTKTTMLAQAQAEAQSIIQDGKAQASSVLREAQMQAEQERIKGAAEVARLQESKQAIEGQLRVYYNQLKQLLETGSGVL